MKKRKPKFCVAALMSIGLVGLHAQSTLNVKENSGSNSSFYTNDIRKMTFSVGEMEVEETNGRLSSYTINGIRKLEFTEISTSVPIFQQREGNYKAIELYPNPVNDLLYVKGISCEECLIIIEVMDLHGKVLLKEVNSLTNRINVSDLRKGIYVCRIYSCDKIENIKFLKQ